jgi:hypothetical protein
VRPALLRAADVAACGVLHQGIRPYASGTLPAKAVESLPQVLRELRKDFGRRVSVAKARDEEAQDLPAVAFEKERRRSLLVTRVAMRANPPLERVTVASLHELR